MIETDESSQNVQTPMWKPLSYVVDLAGPGHICLLVLSAALFCLKVLHLFPVCLMSMWERHPTCLDLPWFNLCIGGMTGKSDSSSQKCEPWAEKAKSTCIGAALSQVMHSKTAPDFLIHTVQTPVLPQIWLFSFAFDFLNFTIELHYFILI